MPQPKDAAEGTYASKNVYRRFSSAVARLVSGKPEATAPWYQRQPDSKSLKTHRHNHHRHHNTTTSGSDDGFLALPSILSTNAPACRSVGD